MKSIKRLVFGAVSMVLAATSVSGIAVAGGHGWEPTKPIDFIIMAGKGGGADKMARLMQAIVEKENLANQAVGSNQQIRWFRCRGFDCSV